MGIFGMITDGGDAPLPKICHAYPTMMKLASCTLPKEDPKIYESRDTPRQFC